MGGHIWSLSGEFPGIPGARSFQKTNFGRPFFCQAFAATSNFGHRCVRQSLAVKDRRHGLKGVDHFAILQPSTCNQESGNFRAHVQSDLFFSRLEEGMLWHSLALKLAPVLKLGMTCSHLFASMVFALRIGGCRKVRRQGPLGGVGIYWLCSWNFTGKKKRKKKRKTNSLGGDV